MPKGQSQSRSIARLSLFIDFLGFGHSDRPERQQSGVGGQVVADSDDIGASLASRQCLHRTGSSHPFFA